MTDKAVEVGQIQNVSVGQSKLTAHLLFESIAVGIGIGMAVEIGNRERFAIPKAIPIPTAHFHPALPEYNYSEDEPWVPEKKRDT